MDHSLICIQTASRSYANLGCWHAIVSNVRMCFDRYTRSVRPFTVLYSHHGLWLTQLLLDSLSAAAAMTHVNFSLCIILLTRLHSDFTLVFVCNMIPAPASLFICCACGSVTYIGHWTCKEEFWQSAPSVGWIAIHVLKNRFESCFKKIDLNRCFHESRHA